jgi:flagellar basal body rod protein FlgG
VNYGFFTAASGAQAAMARQNVASNNLANVSTVGFKPDTLDLRLRDPVRVEDGLPFMDSNALIERLGAGVMPTGTRIMHSQGTLRETGAPLDLAIQGEGFLRVEHEGPGGFALTRDGRMLIEPDGTLVRAGDGRPVLDAQGRRITLDRSLPVRIDTQGTIYQGGAAVAQLETVTVDDPSRLIKGGNGDFRLPSPELAQSLRRTDAVIEQGFVEDSAVNPISALNAVTGASRAAQSNMRMVSTIYEVMGNAINRLGRVG